MFSQKTTTDVSLDQSKSKARGFIRVPQGKIGRMLASDQAYDGLYTDDFSSCNIVVVHSKERMSMIHVDSSIDSTVIESEKKWVGHGAHVKVFFKAHGKFLHKNLFGEKSKIKPIQERAKAISAKFFGGSCLIEELENKLEKIIRHPQENRLETTHKINVAFFELLEPTYHFDPKIKATWKEQISKLVFEEEFWLMPSNNGCQLQPAIDKKIAKFKGKKSEDIQAQLYKEMMDSVQEQLAKMAENLLQEAVRRITRTSTSIAETIWCHYNQYKLHDNAIDAKEINEAYTNIASKREEIKSRCQIIYDFQSHDGMVLNFERMKPFIKKFFCKEESIVLGLENRKISFIEFMEMRIKNPTTDLKQLFESFSSRTASMMKLQIAEETAKIAVVGVSEVPVIPEILPSPENAVSTQDLGSKTPTPVKVEELEGKKVVCQDSAETPVLDKPVANSSPRAATTQQPSPNKAQEKLASSDFPLSQAKKALAYDGKQKDEGCWISAPTRKKSVLQSPKPQSSSFSPAWEDTVSTGSLKKVVPSVQATESRNMTAPPKDDYHFPALSKTKAGSVI